MMDERLAVHLDSMKRAAADAMAFTRDMSRDEFFANTQVQAATAMCLIIVGEGAVRIARRAPEFIEAHPDWAWDQIRGLRNRVVHDYDRLHLPTIWSTVKDYLPVLHAAIDALGELDPRIAPPDVTSSGEP